MPTSTEGKPRYPLWAGKGLYKCEGASEGCEMVKKMSRAAQLEALEQRKKRNEIGRYTIDEAAELVHKHIESQTQTILSLKKSLENLVRKKQVRNFSRYRKPYDFIWPESFSPIKQEPKIIVQCDDLNEVWLPSLNIKWQFPNPFKKVDVFESDSQSAQDSIRNLTKDDWVSKAKEIGIEILKNQKFHRTKFTKDSLAKKIAERFEQDGTRGGRGEILKYLTISRELSRNGWWRNYKNVQNK